MPFEIRQTPLDAVDADDFTYRITRPQDVGWLSASIARVGLLCGPILIPQNGRARVVSGFARLAACRDLGWERIPARWPRQPVDAWRCARWAVAENAAQRPLDPLETGRALMLLRRHAPTETDFREAARCFGLPDQPAAQARFTSLCDLPEAVQPLVAGGTLSLATAASLGRMAPAAALRMAALLAGLRFGANKQREVLELFDEIVRREARSLQEVMQTPDLAPLLTEGDMDRAHRGNQLRSYLYSRRFPALSAARQRFEALGRELCPDPDACLTPPPGFEGRNFQLTLSFASRSDLVRHRSTLDRLLAHSLLDEALELA